MDLDELKEAALRSELTRDYLPYDSEEWLKAIAAAEKEEE